MSFTTLQLLHRLARGTRVPDIAAMSVADRLELLDAVNAGLGDFMELLPVSRKHTPASATLRAPVSLDLSINNGASAFTYVLGSPWPVGGYAAEEDLIGRSVVVTGDARLNRLHRPGELLSAYLGTSGTRAATFYGDAVSMGADERRLVDRPLWEDSSGSRILQALTEPRHVWWSYPFHQAADIEVGTPQFYWTEPLLSAERLTTPTWTIRVWPLPQVLGTLTYRIESFPSGLTLEDFTTPRDLPVAAREVSHLVSLSRAHLQGSSLLAEGTTADDLNAGTRRAAGALAVQPQQTDSRPRRMTTKPGW